MQYYKWTIMIITSKLQEFFAGLRKIYSNYIRNGKSVPKAIQKFSIDKDVHKLSLLLSFLKQNDFQDYCMPTIVHFEIPADDVERAKKFYSDLFGWRMERWPGTEGKEFLSSFFCYMFINFGQEHFASIYPSLQNNCPIITKAQTTYQRQVLLCHISDTDTSDDSICNCPIATRKERDNKP